MDTLISTLVNALVVPLASAVPLLGSSGILLLVFTAAWAAFGLALLRDRSRLERAWARLRRLPVVVQAAAWLLFLPVLAGLWVWRTSWPAVARVALVGVLAGWNLLVFVPRPA